MQATHVTINGLHGERTYKLGKVVTSGSRGTEIECLGAPGLVHRLCYWLPQGIEAGQRVRTSGDELHYHNDALPLSEPPKKAK